jgi:GT2 family glycosyltransferase
MPGEQQDSADIRWLLHNQASLDQRLSRVETSMVFRTLRAIGRLYLRRRPPSYKAWRERGGADLPPPVPLTSPRFTIVTPSAAAERIRKSVAGYGNCEVLTADPQQATGEYIIFLGGHEAIYPGALQHFAAAAPADLIYSDEELLDSSGAPLRPLFKPDWSPQLLQSANYLGVFTAIKRTLLQGHPDLLSAARALRNPSVAHIPAVLYGSRSTLPAPNATPVPRVLGAKVSIIICTRTAHLLETCLAGIRARTSYPDFELLVVQHLGSSTVPEEAAVAQVIAEHGAKRIPYAAPFNFSAMNNLAAAQATGPLLLFLNDDVSPLSPDWLTRLTAWLGRPEVGAAGAKLTFPDGTLQHSGIAAYMIDGAWHPGRNMPRNMPDQSNWPWTQYTREVSAVTGACLTIRAADFNRLGGFDPAFPVNFNDVDLCFRLRRDGLTIILDAEAELRHAESRTRRGGVTYGERRLFFRKWAAELERVDPFYTPHLVQNNEDLSLR